MDEGAVVMMMRRRKRKGWVSYERRATFLSLSPFPSCFSFSLPLKGVKEDLVPRVGDGDFAVYLALPLL